MKFLSKLALSLEPYVPGEQPKDKKYIKLNTNENPYPPSERVLSAIKEEAENLRLYPDPDASAVRTAAAQYYNRALSLTGEDLLTEENIFVGNGSDEVLALLFPAFFKGKKIAFADITYSFYPVYCSLFEVSYELLPLQEDFSFDLDQYCGGLAPDIEGVLLCNPNAPTGRLLPLKEVERILSSNEDKLIAADEAYIDFGGETAAGIVNRYPNLIVTQTLSKSRQLAGMRVGLAIASKPLIAGLNAVPEDMLEAAKIDGANAWTTLWKITIPNVIPSITICTFLTLTNSFKLYDQNLALTDGRPFQQLGNGETVKTTEMLALNIVNAFGTNGGGNRGVGQAKAVIFFIVVAAISIIQLQASRRKEVQQ